MTSFPCAICSSSVVSSPENIFHQDTGAKSLKRIFLLCPSCFCIFVPPAHHITETAEKYRYDHHTNNHEDTGYVSFLKQSILPLAAYLALKKLEQINFGEKSESEEHQQQEHKFPSLEEVLKTEDDYPNNNNNSNDNNNLLARYYAPPKKIKAKFKNDEEAQKRIQKENEFLQSKEQIVLDLVSKAIVSTNSNSSSSSSSQKIEKQQPKFRGLDFGCGPSPTLKQVLQQQIFNIGDADPSSSNNNNIIDDIELYDKYYFPNEEVFFKNVAKEENDAEKSSSSSSKLPSRRSRDGGQQQQQQQQTETEIDSSSSVSTNNTTASASATTNSTSIEQQKQKQEKEKQYYDFITATEVAEHISSSGETLNKLWSHVKPNGGVFVIQTSRTEAHCPASENENKVNNNSSAVSNNQQQKQQQEEEKEQQQPSQTSKKVVAGVSPVKFRDWAYSVRDPTHITFFHIESFRWLRNNKWKDEVKAMLVCGPSTVMFVKK